MTLAQLPPDLITIPQAARRLGIASKTAYELAARGELPGAFRLGRRWRVSVIRLEKHIHGEPS